MSRQLTRSAESVVRNIAVSRIVQAPATVSGYLHVAVAVKVRDYVHSTSTRQGGPARTDRSPFDAMALAHPLSPAKSTTR